jgi:hypothetical protein
MLVTTRFFSFLVVRAANEHLGEKFRLQDEAQRPFPAAAAGG